MLTFSSNFFFLSFFLYSFLYTLSPSQESFFYHPYHHRAPPPCSISTRLFSFSTPKTSSLNAINASPTLFLAEGGANTNLVLPNSLSPPKSPRPLLQSEPNHENRNQILMFAKIEPNARPPGAFFPDSCANVCGVNYCWV